MPYSLPESIKDEFHDMAEALTKSGRPATAMQLAEYPYVVLRGDKVDVSLGLVEARIFAKSGDLLLKHDPKRLRSCTMHEPADS